MGRLPLTAFGQLIGSQNVGRVTVKRFKHRDRRPHIFRKNVLVDALMKSEGGIGVSEGVDCSVTTE